MTSSSENRIVERLMQPQYLVDKNLYEELVELLDKYPEKVDYVDEDGNGDTALHVACFKGNLRMIELLLQKKANVELSNNNGDNPLFVAVFFGYAEMTQMLISYGSNLNRKKSKMQGGYTPLHVACWKGHVDIALQLISNGASLEATNEHQYTPLHVACHYRHIGIVQGLFRKGCSLYAQNYSGDTPLHVACVDGSMDIALLLLRNGADLYFRNSLKETALDLFIDKWNTFNLTSTKEECVALLTDTYLRETKWRRRRNYACFLYSRSKTVTQRDALHIQPTHLHDRIFLQQPLAHLIGSFL